MYAVFDIETGPRDAEELGPLMPEFTAPANYKDPAKIEAAISEKRTEWLERAALSATTGRVLAIGLKVAGEADSEIYAYLEEKVNLAFFWARCRELVKQRCPMIGFNCHRFDLPFLLRRSWVLGVQPASELFMGRPGPAFVDLYQVWQCGDSQASISLDALARLLGVGQKNGSGAEFAKLFATSRDLAIGYLQNDLLLTERVAAKLLGEASWPAAAGIRPAAPSAKAKEGLY